MLTVKDLRKDFASVRAVDGVSFAVEPGQIFGLLGPNGAGKSTTIRIILRILDPDRGTILYDGKPFTPATRDVIGYLPEERGLYRKNKLLDTILYFARLRGMPWESARVSAYHWLQRLSMLPFAGRKIQDLSKGNQQKVQFICAVVHDPKLVILDEPFSGLDPINQNIFKDILLELKQKNKAIIFSTHQMDQAEKLSDHLCLIHKGRMLLGGSVKQVKQTHGANSVHVEFHGDGDFLNTLPGVKRADVFKNTAELELETGTSPQDLLSKLIGILEIRRFEILEPSLHSIFLKEVGQANALEGSFA